MWDFKFSFDPTSGVSLVRQIMQTIAKDIAAGCLRPGAALPGSRRLAEQLGVHRNTVVAAYDGLVAEGWVTTRPAGGTYVAERPPDPESMPFARVPQPQIASACGFALVPRPRTSLYGWQRLPSFSARVSCGPMESQALVLASAAPDWRLFPVALLARAQRRVLGRSASNVLSRAHPKGQPRTRRVLAAMLAARRGLVVDPDNILITRGCTMALRLLAQALLRPGDAVAVETPGHPRAWEALHAAGARLVPIGLDRHGLRLDSLQQALREDPTIRAIYTTPHHQYPTMVAMRPSRRLALLQLAADHRLAIIEDDYDHEFHYEDQTLRPLATADGFGVVIYMGSLSKLAAPGLRLGFLCGPEPLIQRLTEDRAVFDMQGDSILELAIADLSEDGEINSYVRQVRPIYKGRRDALVESLQTHLPQLRFDVPQGGLSLWVKLENAVMMNAWVQACAREGVIFHPEQRFAFDGEPGSAARLGFSMLNESELHEAARRMARALAGLSEDGPACQSERQRRLA